MIKIKKGNHSLLVSKKTYETMFKPIGYIVEEEAPKKASSENKTKHDLNQVEDKNIEVLFKGEGNLTVEEEKPVENDSHENEGDKKDDKKEENKKENGKENSLENILGMLSQKEEEKIRKNNRQFKKEEE